MKLIRAVHYFQLQTQQLDDFASFYSSI